MKNQLIYALKYLNYRLCTKHKKGHGIHSPFMYKLITEVFNKKPDKGLKQVFVVYNKYKSSKLNLSCKDIGAKTTYRSKEKLSVGAIIKRSSVNKKYGKLIYNLTTHFKPQKILELGTSVGISTAFLARAAPNANLKTIEGVIEKVEVAKQIASELKVSPEFVIGNFDQVLDQTLDKSIQLDLVFFDGNHTKKSTLTYFSKCLKKVHNDTIFVFDDIHWSEEMEAAWDQIRIHDQVKVSVDLFRLGLIFFKKELSYQHYVIKF